MSKMDKLSVQLEAGVVGGGNLLRSDPLVLLHHSGASFIQLLGQAHSLLVAIVWLVVRCRRQVGRKYDRRLPVARSPTSSHLAPLPRTVWFYFKLYRFRSAKRIGLYVKKWAVTNVGMLDFAALMTMSGGAERVLHRVWQPWSVATDEKPRTVCERSSSFSSAKELPTKIQKQRRKDRRNADYLTTKLRTQRSLDSPTMVRLERDLDPTSSDDDSVPSFSSGTLDLDDSSPHEDEDDNDMPLDMTTTNRQTPSEIVGGSNLRLGPNVVRRFYARPTIQIGPGGAVQQQHRPSVIKCASELVQLNQGRGHRSSKSDADKSRGSEVRHGHRREVLSGMCDPVIDEHFRRSLGKDYPEYFSTPSVPNTVSVSGLSVDDHFAKALGDTWLRLQKSNRSDSGTSAGSSSSLSPPPSPPVVQQLHVVST